MQPIENARGFRRGAALLVNVGKAGAVYDVPETLSLDEHRPVLLAGNHRSLFDLVAALATFRSVDETCRVMVRADLVDGKGLGGRFFRGIGCIPTSRDNREEAEAAAIEALLNHELVCMMPEGRLVKPTERINGVGPGRPGVSRIARAANALVLPVGISGSAEVWPRAGKPKPRIKRPTVTVRVGTPLDLQSDDHEANTALVMAAISSLLIED